jgi:hypothetical protein
VHQLRQQKLVQEAVQVVEVVRQHLQQLVVQVEMVFQVVVAVQTQGQQELV